MAHLSPAVTLEIILCRKFAVLKEAKLYSVTVHWSKQRLGKNQQAHRKLTHFYLSR